MEQHSPRTNDPRSAPDGPAGDRTSDHLHALSSLLERLDDQSPGELEAGKTRDCDFENHLVQVRLGIASSLFAALRAKHAPTAAHSLRVSIGCSAWSSFLKLPDQQRDEIEVAALLHDIGKIGVPDSVLKKPAALTLEEQNLMARHRRTGLDILRPAVVSTDLLNILKYAAGWYDGSRHGLDRKQDDLPLGSRLIAIVDAFDAMTTDQIYRPAMSRERAVAELYRHAGTQFAPDLVEHFCRLVMSDVVDLNAEVCQRWLKQLDPQRADQMWRLQSSSGSELGTPYELFHEKLLQSMQDGVVFADVSGLILYWNRGAERLTGVPTSAVVDKYWDPEMVGMCDEFGAVVAREQCPLLESLASRAQTVRRLSVAGHDKMPRPVDAHCIPVIGRDGAVHGAALLLHDASSRATLEERVQSLHQRATQDPLTKVANRAEFNRVHDQLVETLGSRGRRLSLIMCDLDYFKIVNDQYGHQAGDEALIKFAALLTRFCRGGDLVSRFGGEEFVMLCADCGNATATARAEEIRHELAAMPLAALDGKCLTASFGVTELQAGDTPETMLRRADRALMQAKEHGRNRVVQLGAGMDEEDKPKPSRGWFSWFEVPRARQIAEQNLVTHVPFDVAIQKLRGFIADHEAELMSADKGSLVIKIEGESVLWRRKSDREVPFLVDLVFADDDQADESTLSRTLIHVTVRPLRNRDRRRADLSDRAGQLLVSLKSYLMATEYQPRRKTPAELAERV